MLFDDAIKELRAGGGPLREPGGCDHVGWEDRAERGASSPPSSDPMSVMREDMYEAGRGGSRLFSAVCRFESSGMGGLGEVDMASSRPCSYWIESENKVIISYIKR